MKATMMPRPEPNDPGRMVRVGDLVGCKEIAWLLGWTTNKVGAYHARRAAGMPDPLVKLAGGALWDMQDILRWAASRGYPLAHPPTAR